MKKGFTTIELIFALSVMSLAIAFFAIYQYRIKEIEKANILIQQTRNYVKVFNGYIKHDYKQLKQIVDYDKVLVISIDYILNRWKINLPKTNILNQRPCFNIIKDKVTGNFEGIMYYVSEHPQKYVRTLFFMNKVFADLGEMAGVYYASENTVKPIKYFWEISSTSPLLNNFNACKSNFNIVDNSIVINLSLNPDFNRILFAYNAINKGYDNIDETELGDVENKHTSLTDLAFSSESNYSINFTPDEFSDGHVALEIGQQDKSKVILKGGTLFASTLQANTYKSSGDLCNSDEIGQVAMQQDNLKTGLVQGTLVCTYNPLACNFDKGKGTGDYCFLPNRVNEIIYKNGQNNKMGNRFVCPAQMPFAKNVNAWYKPLENLFEYRDKYKSGAIINHILFCKDSYYEEWCNEYRIPYFYWCSDDLGMKDYCTVKLYNINLSWPNRILDTYSAIFTPKPIINIVNNHKLVIGYEFNDNSYEENCNILCTAITPYSDGEHYYKDYIPMKYPEYFYYGGRKFCLCRPKKIEGEGYNAIVALPSVKMQPMFDSITCSSKMEIEAMEY